MCVAVALIVSKCYIDADYKNDLREIMHRWIKYYRIRGLLLLTLAFLLGGAAAEIPTAAQNSGTARERVFIALNVDTLPEPQLSAAAVNEQRALIQAAQAVVPLLLGPNATARVRIRYQTLPYLVAEIDPATQARLLASPLVREITPDPLYKLQIESPAPALTSSANLVVGAPEAWANGFDGRGQSVAVIDTGVDRNHPALAGRVVFEGCFTNNDCAGGTDVVIGAGAAQPFACSQCAHGTHVAGIIAGRDGNFSGVAPGANIVALNAFTLFGDDDGDDDLEDDDIADDPFCGNGPALCTGSYISDQVLALEYVYLYRNIYNIAAVNMSLGSPNTFGAVCDNVPGVYQPFLDMVATLRLVDVAVIAASGNSSDSDGMSSPACFSQVISVGAVNDGDGVAGFSNATDFLDLLAPGVGITSSMPGGVYGTMNGTSMATPYVSGTWAIMRQIYPSLTLDETLDRFKRTGRLVNDARNGLTFPRLQVNALIREALGYPYIPPGLTNAFVTRRDFEQVLLAQSAGDVVPLGVRFIGRQLEITVNSGGVEVVAMVRLWSEDGTITFAVESQQRLDGASLSTATRTRVSDALPAILVATFDTILESPCFDESFDADIVYIDDLSLLRIYGTPAISCPAITPNG